jgi:hypothetical protein
MSLTRMLSSRRPRLQYFFITCSHDALLGESCRAHGIRHHCIAHCGKNGNSGNRSLPAAHDRASGKNGTRRLFSPRCLRTRRRHSGINGNSGNYLPRLLHHLFRSRRPHRPHRPTPLLATYPLNLDHHGRVPPHGSCPPCTWREVALRMELPARDSHSHQKRPDMCVAPQRDVALVYQASRLAECGIAPHPLQWRDSQTTPWRDPL